MKRFLIIGTLVGVLAWTAGSAVVRPDAAPEVVSVAKTPGAAARLARLGLDLLAEAGGRIYVVAGPADLVRLERAGFPYRLETGRLAPAAPRKPEASGDINGAFHSYPEVEADLESLEQSHPDLAKVYDLGYSLEMRHVYALKISANVQTEENGARVLFLGCHHAREWISVEVPLLFAEYAVGNYATDPVIHDLLDHAEVWVVPLVNPDGLEYSIYDYRYWRKNRRDNGDGSFGVDVNRNYGYAWGIDNEGSSPDPASDIYRGAAAFSEPESRAVRDLIASKGFQALISFHSYSQDILYPWGYTTTPTPDDAKLRAMAAAMSAKIQAVNGRVYEYGEAGPFLYLTNGELTDWAYALFHVMAFTIELPPQDYFGGEFFNAEEDIQPIFRENLPAMEYLIGQAEQEFAASPQAHGPAAPGAAAPAREKRPIKD